MLSKWAAVRSDKVLPNKYFAGQFQYRHYINWEVMLYGLGIGARQANGGWNMKIADPSGKIIFEQDVKLQLTLVYMGAGGLQFFTWYFSKEVIDTKIVNGVPATGDNVAWKFTLGGRDTSEFGNMIPGGGSDYSDQYAYINGFWESPVYKINIPEGSKLIAFQDSFSMGASRRVEWHFRFLQGKPPMLVDCKYGPFGELTVARGLDATPFVQVGHTWDGEHFRGFDGFEDSSNPSIINFPNGRQIVAVLQEDGYWEYESFDHRRWKKVQYPTEDPTKKQEIKLSGPEVEMPQLVRFGPNRLMIARDGSELIVRHISDVGVENPIVVGNTVGELDYALDVSKSGQVDIVDNSGRVAWTSKDGKRWERKIYSDA